MSIRTGIYLPQNELEPDPQVMRGFAQAVEEMGYDYLVIADHVLGADVSVRPHWRPRGGPPPYTKDNRFHEVFVLYGFLAACTTRLGLAPSVVILPQRQTAVVAKQAAELDVLSGGRFRLGIGTGWNDVEYEALGADFRSRGACMDEQITLLRALWTQETVTFKGRWHTVNAAGLNPLPVQRPIPIWMGGTADVALRRIGRVGDGWLAGWSLPFEQLKQAIARVKGYALEAGRDAGSIGIECQVKLAGKSSADIGHTLAFFGNNSVTHVTVRTDGAGLSGLDAHLEVAGNFRRALSQAATV